MDPLVIYWAVLVAANIPLYLLGGWAIFGSWSEFGECIRYAITPDAWSWIKGEWADDMWAEMKLAFFVIGCGGVVFLEHFALQKWIFTGP